MRSPIPTSHRSQCRHELTAQLLTVLALHIQEALDKHAGIPGLEVVDPAVPGFAQKAAFLLNRDGVSAICTHQRH